MSRAAQQQRSSRARKRARRDQDPAPGLHAQPPGPAPGPLSARAQNVALNASSPVSRGSPALGAGPQALRPGCPALRAARIAKVSAGNVAENPGLEVPKSGTETHTHTDTHARARTRTPSPKLIKISRQIQSAAAAAGQRRPPAAERTECQRLDTVTFIRHRAPGRLELISLPTAPSREGCLLQPPASPAPHLPSV